MAAFTFDDMVPELPHGVDSAALGVDANNKLVANDINKAVKLAANNNYIVASAGDDLEGVLLSIEANTVNNGFSFGSVRVRFKHQKATVVGATLVVGDEVVCAAQAALGTAQPYPNVQKLDSETPVLKWRVKSLLAGNGSAGTVVLLEPLTR